MCVETSNLPFILTAVPPVIRFLLPSAEITPNVTNEKDTGLRHMTSSVPTGSFPHPWFGSSSTCILWELNMKTCLSFKVIYSNVWLIQCRLRVPFKVLLFQGWFCRCIYVLKMVKSNPPWLFIFYFYFFTGTFKLCNASLLLYCNGTLLTDTHKTFWLFITCQVAGNFKSGLERNLVRKFELKRLSTPDAWVLTLHD